MTKVSNNVIIKYQKKLKNIGIFSQDVYYNFYQSLTIAVIYNYQVTLNNNITQKISIIDSIAMIKLQSETKVAVEE